MRIGSSIALIAIGAILAFAVADVVDFVDLTLIGWILMGVGALGLIISIVMAIPRNDRRVTETRQVQDPNTGETIRRDETRGSL
ncbi:hypothetical protein E4J89_08180 [Arthrobacter sp. CAU 1506]|uniref:DUF6458 family protein n=1 Tax=Arthrobacter sp. CAU 1506 TaxID=2560052 RepID=UPI0010ACCEC4|nr:DUF6458 family protein [Arthrobacter sp. CAU 1506]TJY70210.1 hypothetical protein E4J89_08180 [Arthrobacter sp. CAU 1506]